MFILHACLHTLSLVSLLPFLWNLQALYEPLKMKKENILSAVVMQTHKSSLLFQFTHCILLHLLPAETSMITANLKLALNLKTFECWYTRLAFSNFVTFIPRHQGYLNLFFIISKRAFYIFVMINLNTSCWNKGNPRAVLLTLKF